MKPAVLAALLALGTAVLALGLWSGHLPDLEVRSAPRRVSLGEVRPGTLTGEAFHVQRDGLERIDVAVTDFTDQPPAEVEFVLRADGPAGAELRRVRAERLEPMEQGGWLVFAFEPVADSAGRSFHAAFGPAPGVESCRYGPWIRFRGAADRGAGWSEKTFTGPLVEGRFLSLNENLRGLAFGGEVLGGAAQLVLFDAEGRELRRARVDNPEPIEWGWLVFGFEPVLGSRWKTYGFRLELSPTAILRGSVDGPARVAFYGGGRVDERLLGLTRGTERFEDRDLCLRTWTDNGPGLVLQRLGDRLGWRLVPLVLAWLLASCLLPAALGRTQGP